MSAPYEIIAAPFDVWLAPVATAFPLIDATPGGSWTKVGTSGNLNYKRDGVTVSHAKSTVKFRALGDLGARKVFVTELDLMIRFVLADMTLENYAIALNHNIVTTVPAGGEAGYKKIGLSHSATITQKALLLRGPSPYDEDLYMQYEVPIVVQDGTPEPVFQLGEPAGLALQFSALVDTTAATEDERFGRLVASHLPAVS